MTHQVAQRDRLARLSAAGVSIWLDDFGRRRLRDGSLGRLGAHGPRGGGATHPPLFARAITGSDAYDKQLRELALRRVEVDEALRSLTTADVREACDVLRPVFAATN